MVSAAQPTPDVARAHRAVEPLHNHVYFSPEQDEYLTAVGLRPGRMCYFAGRAAAMGAVGPGTVTATFVNFAPALVARRVPPGWSSWAAACPRGSWRPAPTRRASWPAGERTPRPGVGRRRADGGAAARAPRRRALRAGPVAAAQPAGRRGVERAAQGAARGDDAAGRPARAGGAAGGGAQRRHVRVG